MKPEDMSPREFALHLWEMRPYRDGEWPALIAARDEARDASMREACIEAFRKWGEPWVNEAAVDAIRAARRPPAFVKNQLVKRAMWGGFEYTTYHEAFKESDLTPVKAHVDAEGRVIVDE